MFKINFEKYDFTLIAAVCICTVFGAFMVFSSSAVMADVKWTSPYKFFLRQILWVIFGFAAMFVTSFLINYKFYKRYAKWIYLFALVLVIAVLFVGVLRLGAKRWLQVGPFTLQPSELAKIAVVIAIADFISRKKKLVEKWKGLIAPGFIILLMLFPIVVEPDLGTPILVAVVCFAMLFCAGMKMNVIFAGGLALILLMVEEIMRKPYRLTRVKDYLASFVNIDVSSYQVKQSLNALGSGGFWGKGLGKSEMKLMYLPEAHTDFIFPIIGEELGFLGAVSVIAFFMYLFFKGIKMSKNMPDVFSQYLCLGITFLIVFQAIINISVATGVFPAKGLALPFISFGGTALIITMATSGILINLSQYNKKQSRT
ncbi:stage V sporulation protein E [Endomicrobiia bacterium]|uniref:putative lipid II flippase FtsW n=1 Tax=Endomicrobium trichonymphae TaxID=1408204 RepID=UPI00221D35F7|nr:stage V sporulation protein E [Endomicrobiia bacterium]GMO54819.1 MAG: stage V sporulation protein E [Candidatus Endomicrobium trichonymphae]GHT08176.1 stage V sporulation protein E [Endomicrobiia bacterium]GHT13689.1 stage V sporulation protein E [Endomicrobiia bacterium]GHT17047.1 stage V sporulation protein E [Endomicrobiia bacterium]